jgi:plastocyanin
MRHARLAALALPLMLAIAACSGSSTTAPTAPPSSAPPPAASAAPSAAPPAAAGNTVSIASFSFQPAELTVAVGTTVTWTNNDSASHTVTADDGSFKSGTLGNGATFSQTFATPGTFAYHCAIHSSMKGTITVH